MNCSRAGLIFAVVVVVVVVVVVEDYFRVILCSVACYTKRL